MTGVQTCALPISDQNAGNSTNAAGGGNTADGAGCDGIQASATAAAPLWLYESHPEVLPVDLYGHTVNAGSRQSWQPTSPVFKEYALRLCRRLAEHYKDNPYVTAWHMGNEYGWNNR